ncbi:TetR/AcrR family transcriptional regulator [Peterkaempfera sp. SMS 1(5)a]|uniref:TetR/AcrR family transcriptional regulator n=1 Tax=Peterkaempfera podocarpi TaxID=3232308 RepID=UPI00366CEAEB
MSEIEPVQPPRRRRRRADAERSRAAILSAAIALLSERPEASMDDIAEAAAVTRQTVYAHYASREILLGAVVDQATQEALAAIDAADLDRGPAPEALLRFLDASWGTLERLPLLGRYADAATPQTEHARHQPVLDRLVRLVRRGQEAGDFDRGLSPAWLLAATVALGHSAGEQVATGGVTPQEASRSLKTTVLRVYGVRAADQP